MRLNTTPLQNKERHRALTDDEFETQFREHTFRPGFFTHEAHFRLAWIHLTRYGLESAIENIRTQIKGYAEAVGATQKYNDTVTVAAVYLTHHFMGKATGKTFEDLMLEFPQLKADFKGVLGQYYSTNIFSNAEAKANYLPPDLQDFEL